MKYLILLTVLFLSSNSLIAQDTISTKIIVRAKAKDAKFIGSSVGSAMIIIRNAETNEILAKGKTIGSTGNTSLIMKTPSRARKINS